MQQAALELFTRDGYAATTAAAIAARADVTERTFFRYFPDKREVLFDDGQRLERLLLDALSAGSRVVAEALPRALRAVAADMQPRREMLVQRAALVSSVQELAERELWKLQHWTRSLTETLTEWGVDGLSAAANAEVAMAVFRAAFTRWVTDEEAGELADLLGDTVTAVGLDWVFTEVDEKPQAER
ncbi:TetR family transcriptional regulator [Lentzea sp. NPDC092896]|uniref:TetR family transcriptional regulator n=1 Tax=Lentzea sp. NPDC092896 TaxID=3364127 RepID=UPI00381DC37F